MNFVLLFILSAGNRSRASRGTHLSHPHMDDADPVKSTPVVLDRAEVARALMPKASRGDNKAGGFVPDPCPRPLEPRKVRNDETAGRHDGVAARNDGAPTSMANPPVECLYDAALIKRCQGLANYEPHNDTLPCLIFMYFKKWQRMFPLMAKQTGESSIEGVMIYTLNGYFRGRWTNMSREIENALGSREGWLKNPPTEAQKERSRALVKRLGLNFVVA